MESPQILDHNSNEDNKNNGNVKCVGAQAIELSRLLRIVTIIVVDCKRRGGMYIHAVEFK